MVVKDGMLDLMLEDLYRYVHLKSDEDIFNDS